MSSIDATPFGPKETTVVAFLNSGFCPKEARGKNAHRKVRHNRTRCLLDMISFFKGALAEFAQYQLTALE
jgi:hypothetical protein